MKILELIGGLGGGGAEGQLLALVRALRADGMEVRVAALKRVDGRTGQALREEGVDVDDLGGRRRLDPRPLARLRGLVRDWQPSLVHSHLGRADLLAGITCSMARVPHVITRHSTFESWFSLPLMRRAYGRMLGRARCIAVSDAVAERLADWGATDVTTVPGLLLDPSLLELPARSERRVVGFLGRIDRVKGADLFLDVARRLLDARPDLELLVGGDGPLRRRLQRRCELPVEWLGWVDRRDFLERVDLLVVPSRREGLGLSAAEALAAGRPVVASAVGGLIALCADRPDALLVEPRANALAEGVLAMLTSPPVPRAAPALSLDPAAFAAAHREVFLSAARSASSSR